MKLRLLSYFLVPTHALIKCITSLSRSSSSSSSASTTGDATYTFFKFDVDITKATVTIPSELAQSLPPVAPASRIQSYLPVSFGRKGSYFFSHKNCVAIKQFEEQQACSTRDGTYSTKLWSTMIDRKQAWWICVTTRCGHTTSCRSV